MSDTLTTELLWKKAIAAHKRYFPLRLQYEWASSAYIGHCYDHYSRFVALYLFIFVASCLFWKYCDQPEVLVWEIKAHLKQSLQIGALLIGSALFIWFRPPSLSKGREFQIHRDNFLEFRAAYRVLENDYIEAREAASRSSRDQKGKVKI